MPKKIPPCPAPGTPEGLNRHRQRHERSCDQCRLLFLPGLSSDRLRKRARRAALTRLVRRFPEIWALYYAVEKAKLLIAEGERPELDLQSLANLIATANQVDEHDVSHAA